MIGSYCASRRIKRENVSTQVSADSSGPAPSVPLVTSATGGAGQASITWTAPTVKQDGSDLATAAIRRHWVYIGTTEGEQRLDGAYSQRLEVSYPTLTRTITGLSAGVHILAVSCESYYAEGDVSFEYSVTVT